ncbi:hypothetical protein [Pseudanabaena sp. FACHB-2040]|uniref:hypothetical protein n=1 Tax=Pseudanabaena sp. FACHB-2040 TaxID=2692859 RepID=UPI00168677B5|nr:hypothetical protein [Pseudanabaena sp. FACHB-2040]MBD2258925.1 hypothetical protein [Pseudanabaena sp. FACHB-2040]
MPTQESPWSVLSGYQVRQFLAAALGVTDPELRQAAPAVNLFFLSFSAGCLGAVAAARHWYALGGSVGALFAVDGWGVALAEPFPVYRLSHDRFTHETSALLGSQHTDFYADPPVSHLDLWRSPHEALGWQVVGKKAIAEDWSKDWPLENGSQRIRPAALDLANQQQGQGTDPSLAKWSLARTPTTAADFICTWLEQALKLPPTTAQSGC